MRDKKKSFIIYSDIEEVLNELTDEEAGRLFRAMVAYSITGEVQDLGMPLRYVFIPIRQQMDRDLAKWNGVKEQRSRAGRKGGAPKGNSNARSKALQEAEKPVTKNKQNKQKQAKQTKQAVNVNVNGNVNENVNGNVIKDGPEARNLSISLLSYLNEKTGGKHQPSEAVTERIAELMKDGYSADDFREVIDKKTAEWINVPIMRKYLRPSTLFGEKFPEYVAEPSGKEMQMRHESEYDRQNISPAVLEEILTNGG